MATDVETVEELAEADRILAEAKRRLGLEVGSQGAP